jgi:hypothetical protein
MAATEPVVVQHQASRITRQPEAGGQVDRHYPFEILIRPLHKLGAMLHPGIVDQNVEPAVLAGHFLEGRTAGPCIADIEGERRRSNLAGRRRHGARIAPVDEYAGTVIDQCLRHGEA